MSIFSIFKKGLQKSATKVTRSISGVFTGTKSWDDEAFDDLEAHLIQSDFGVAASVKIVDNIRDRYSRGLIATDADIAAVCKDEVRRILSTNPRQINRQEGKLCIILFVGVNGSGKTTTIGKLAYLLKNEGNEVMLAACDTFRAAAVEQLKIWGEKVGVPVISAHTGSDPASVAYDAVQSALAKGADFLLIDSAGRQHNKKNLMDELTKIRRSCEKLYPGAPQEVWLTVDASLGANAVSQAREFSKAAGVNGLVLTKLDGSGKGGMAVALHQEFELPTFFVGLGEGMDDLQRFDPGLYADALFSDDTGEE